jgi:hypothetical protein
MSYGRPPTNIFLVCFDEFSVFKKLGEVYEMLRVLFEA